MIDNITRRPYRALYGRRRFGAVDVVAPLLAVSAALFVLIQLSAQTETTFNENRTVDAEVADEVVVYAEDAEVRPVQDNPFAKTDKVIDSDRYTIAQADTLKAEGATRQVGGGS